MTYRIVTNHGTVDFAGDLEIAERKYLMYVNDMHQGYSSFVKLVSVNTDTQKEETIRSDYQREEQKK